MQTYKYSFPASGDLMSEEKARIFTESLENRLTNGPDCLMAWCVFPSDSDILDHVSINREENGSINAINLHTYTRAWEGRENDLESCVKENLGNIMEQEFSGSDIGAYIEGGVEFLGREGETPKTLYHIAERDDITDILENGLIPGTGANNYKSDHDYVYLCEKEDIAPWLAVLKHNENPVILEVSTEGLNGIEPGRMFSDRDYVPEKYGEYRAKDPIPASAIKEADLGYGYNELGSLLHRKMFDMLHHSVTGSDIKEVSTGLERLKDMGVIRDMEFYGQIEAHKQLLAQVGKDHIAEYYREEDEPVAKGDAGKENEVSEFSIEIEEDESLPWDDEVEEDFSKAVGQISLSSDNLNR